MLTSIKEIRMALMTVVILSLVVAVSAVGFIPVPSMTNTAILGRK